MTTTSALEQLMSGYFHQDFIEDYGDIWGTLTAFCAEEPRLTQALPAEIAHALDLFPSESETEAHLDALGSCVYLDPALSYSYRDWLREIATRVRAHLGDQ